MTDLKPCPWCGEKPELEADSDVQCGQIATCKTVGCVMYWQADIPLIAWNAQRGVDAAVHDAVGRERGRCVNRVCVGAAAERERLLFNGCFTGDCPHDSVHDCIKFIEADIREGGAR